MFFLRVKYYETNLTLTSQFTSSISKVHVKKYSLQERVGRMLLIHGEADENSGTYPMQSERYFAALKAFGKFSLFQGNQSSYYIFY